MRNQGFSLLEIIVVLVILSILLSFAYPSYQQHLLRMHRLEGQMALLDLANRMEAYFATFDTYAEASIGSGSERDVLSTAMTSHGWYALSIQSASETHFILQASPQNTQAKYDMRCQTLRFDAQGHQSIAAGPSGNPQGTWQECWG